jgi:predicted Fe-S protein YdhL (DUF1289 family)
MSDILTPCQKVCILDQSSGLCRGCGRKAEEIAAWLSMSNSERARIMALLPGRLAAFGVAPIATSSAG